MLLHPIPTPALPTRTGWIALPLPGLPASSEICPACCTCTLDPGEARGARPGVVRV